MMNKTFSLRGAKCRYLALLPMLLIAFACTSKIETMQEELSEAKLTNASEVTLLVNGLGYIMMEAQGFDAVLVPMEELPEKLGMMDVENTIVTIIADKDTPMPVITDIKDSLRKLGVNRLSYQLYEEAETN